MNKSEAKKRIEKLRKEINHHNYKYYVENNPEISDYEFDQLLKELERLESEFPDLATATLTEAVQSATAHTEVSF